MLGQASLELRSGATARPLLAQASLEFMLTAFLVLILLGISVGIYATSMEEGNALRSSLEANRICIMASSELSSIASVRGSANYTFDFPAKINGENYTIYIVAAKRAVKVDFASRAGVGCGLPAMNITNSTGAAFFELKKNATAQWKDKVLKIVP